jgi:hypothetical protein
VDTGSTKFDGGIDMVGNAEDFELKQKSEQRLFELKRKVTEAVQEIGLEGQRAQVALALDISGSMVDLFDRGVVQQVVERVLALSVKFDDNGAVDIFLFGAGDYAVGELKEAEFFGYVDRVIRAGYDLESDTCYAGAIQRITRHYAPPPRLFGSLLGRTATKPDPAYVLFVTDGDNSDPVETEQALIAASDKPIFWQFVGVGTSNFSFLKRLDTMPGRHIDNANFFQVNDIARIDDGELYRRLLGEFPAWLELARRHDIMT